MERRHVFPYWTATFPALHMLYGFGLDPASEEVQRAIAPVHEAARWDYDPNFRFLRR